ncbi:MAG: cation diffusion facilitator family transporter [Alphaproteobacteria bacterium]
MTQVRTLPSDAARLMRAATYASVATAAVLVAVKLGAWVVTESVSMLATLVDSLLDVLASLVNMFAVRHALQPADAEHRFGHGKAEALAGLAQAAFISGSAVFLLFEAGNRLLHPKPVLNTAVGIAVMVFAIVATLALVAFQRYVVRKTGSLAISADSLHYVSDVLANGSVILALVLSTTLGWFAADPLFGAGIVVYILYSAWTIARRALQVLMDRELPDGDRERIRRIALTHPEVRDMHDLRTRSSGPQRFIQLHLEMDGALTLTHAHEIADQVEAEILAVFPDAEVIIHQDPEGIAEKRATFA